MDLILDQHARLLDEQKADADLVHRLTELGSLDAAREIIARARERRARLFETRRAARELEQALRRPTRAA